VLDLIAFDDRRPSFTHDCYGTPGALSVVQLS
jgi:hypothetical protein